MDLFISIVSLILLILIFVINRSGAGIYHLKHAYYYGLTSFCAFLYIPYFAYRPKNVINLLTASTVLSPISKVLGLKWELRGAEHINKRKCAIIVANHQSSLDILGMFDIWHTMGLVTVIAKREILFSGPFGLAAYLCGLIFVRRGSLNETRRIMIDAIERLKPEKIKLWLFPEGKRHNTGKIHPFKKGAFHLAIETKTPIIPVVYSSFQTFLNDEKRILKPGEIIIECLPEISTENYTIDNIDELMDKVHKLMSETFYKNSEEIKSRKM